MDVPYAPGSSTTFIRFGSPACSRANHAGPSLSGATAVIRDCTLICPLASNGSVWIFMSRNVLRDRPVVIGAGIDPKARSFLA